MAIAGLVGLYKDGNLDARTKDEENSLKEEMKKLEIPSYIPWLMKKSRENINLNKAINLTALRCASGSKL